jgi:glycosyltransferase involved in cell wall biosynthesis
MVLPRNSRVIHGPAGQENKKRMPDTGLPLVSLIIPAYNSRAYVCDAVDSCLAQTYPNCEIVVVDDGSTDDTPDLLRTRYGDRIRLIEQANRGAAGARNTGVREARGEFVQFCDSDDRLLPEKVQAGYELFQQMPDIALVYTFARIVLPDDVTEVPLPDVELPSGDLFCLLLSGYGNFVGTSTVMVRRQAVLEAGGFDENLPVAQDWDLWLRLASRWPFGAINKPLMIYRKRPGSLQSDSVNLSEDRLRVVQRARDYPRRAECLDDRAYDEFEASRHHKLAMLYWEAGRRADARRALRSAVDLDPAHAAARRLYIPLSYVIPAQMASRLVRIGTQLKSLVR